MVFNLLDCKFSMAVVLDDLCQDRLDEAPVAVYVL